MTAYVRGLCWGLLTCAGLAAVAWLWRSDPGAWIYRRCRVTQDLQAAEPARDPGVVCRELARSALPPGAWHWLLAAGVVVGILAAVLLVLLVLTPSFTLQGTVGELAEAERTRVRTAAGGTAKAAAGFAAAVVTAGFQADALVPPAYAVGAVLGVGTLLLLAAEASHATRA
jgi:hypothetical protein